jgi:hypothetical protein
MHLATTLAPATTAADLDRLGDEIAELSAHLDAATARLLVLLRDFDARGGWANGFHSCADWLSWRVGLDPGAARERVRVARALQGHHLHHWANGGPTRLDNLALLCWGHHRAVHEEGYGVVRDTDGTLHFSTPGGRPIPDVPAPQAVPPEPTWALVTANRARGLAIHARTGCPSWGGERLDIGWAIGVLHPAANPDASRPAGRAP